MPLKNKNILIGVSSSIAAYKAAGLVSSLRKMGANINVIMTENATKIISPIVFENLSNNKCYTDTFDRNFQWDVKHISLAKWADIFVVAPATANIIAKIANGICDDMLSTTICASKSPKIIVPAMNTGMYENPVTIENISKLRNLGYKIVEPDTGYLACGDIGKGKFPDNDKIIDSIILEIGYKKDLQGKNVLVSAGATKEAMDPVRYVTNHSSGKMGLAIANAAKYRGANVKLVLGENKIDLNKIYGMDIIKIDSAIQMHDAVINNFKDADIVCMSAAVADYRPLDISENKIKKKDGDLVVKFVRNPDILKKMGEQKRSDQIICGFSMETENLIENSRKKLENKNADIIVANDLTQEGAGFGTDTNIVKIISKSSIKSVELMQKSEIAHIILDEIVKL